MLDVVKTYLKGFAADRKGISAIEYGILGAVVVVAVLAIGPSVTSAITAVFAKLTTAIGT